MIMDKLSLIVQTATLGLVLIDLSITLKLCPSTTVIVVKKLILITVLFTSLIVAVRPAIRRKINYVNISLAILNAILAHEFLVRNLWKSLASVIKKHVKSPAKLDPKRITTAVETFEAKL